MVMSLGALAALTLGGSALGAAGNIAGGFLGRPSDSPGNNVLVAPDPGANRALNASTFDALGALGFGDPSMMLRSSPSQQTAARVQALPIDEKTKRRGLIGVQELFAGGSLSYPGETQQVLARLGLTPQQVRGDLRQRDIAFREAISGLSDELGPLNAGVIRDRASANASIADSLAGFASGEEGELQRMIRQQIQRDQGRAIGDARQATLLRSRAAGLNPSFELAQLDEREMDLRLDAELAALERALATTGAVSQILGNQNRTAQGAAGQGINAELGAAGIAANQANATNALRNANARDSASSLASGIASAGAFGQQGFNTLAALGMLGGEGIGSTAPAAGNAGPQDFVNGGGFSNVPAYLVR